MQVFPCSFRSRHHACTPCLQGPTYFPPLLPPARLPQHSRMMLRCLRCASPVLGAAAVRPSAQVCSLRHKHESASCRACARVSSTAMRRHALQPCHACMAPGIGAPSRAPPSSPVRGCHPSSCTLLAPSRRAQLASWQKNLTLHFACSSVLTQNCFLMSDLVPLGQRGEAKAAHRTPPLDSPNTAVRAPAPSAAHQHAQKWHEWE